MALQPSNSLTAFPTALQAALQTNMLDREFEEGLDSILAYRVCAEMEMVNARIGDTITRTRKGRAIPVPFSLSPSSINANIDNTLTPQSFALEQYTLTLANYAASADVNLVQELAGIADQMIAYSRNNGVQAAQTLERLAKLYLFAAYCGGNTVVTTSGGASTTTTAHVNDIRGFQTVLVNGVVTPISSANPLLVYEYADSPSGLGINQVLTVTAATADATNVSTFPGVIAGKSDGISGTLTFNTSGAPINGDSLIAVNAPTIYRPGGKQNTSLLTAGDVLTLSLILDAVADMRNNAVPPLDDGAYRCVLDNSSMRALFSDQDFKVLFAGRDMAQEYQSADIVSLLGVKFIPTTEAYVQRATPAAGVNVTVRRPIIVGAEALIQGNFEGLDMWLNRDGFEPIGKVMLVNDVAQIVRPPLDRLQQVVSMSWTWIGGFAVPTDITATTDIIPTASNALYKRAAVIEHAG